jgi:hypothetical protein
MAWGQFQFPPWLTWNVVLGVPSAIAAWLGLGLAWRRERRERTVIVFSLEPTTVWEGDVDSGSGTDYDAVRVTVTNEGKRPITIEKIVFVYVFSMHGASDQLNDRTLGVNQRLDEGDAFSRYVTIAPTPVSFTKIRVVDSTGKEWLPSKRAMANLRKSAAKKWSSFRL